MTPTEKRALQFAYTVLRREGERPASPALHHPRRLTDPHQPLTAPSRGWLRPDSDSQRPYLDEAVFTDLAMRGYLEVRAFWPGPVWLYRLAPAGAAALGERWPGDPDVKALRPSRRAEQRLKLHDPQARLRPSALVNRRARNQVYYWGRNFGRK